MKRERKECPYEKWWRQPEGVSCFSATKVVVVGARCGSGGANRTPQRKKNELSEEWSPDDINK